MDTAILVALGLVVGLLGVLVAGLLRSHGEILRALHDRGIDAADGRPGSFAPTRPEAGADPVPAPRSDVAVSSPMTGSLPEAIDLQGTAPDGALLSVAVTGVEHETLLCFLTTGCDMCLGFWEALADPSARAALGPRTRVVAVTQGEQSEMRSAVLRMAPPDVTTVMSTDAWDAYGVPVAPFFALVDGPSGRVVGEGAAPAFPQLLDLLGRAQADTDDPRPRGQGNQRQREADTDEVLRSSGILPGDPRLHHPGEAPVVSTEGAELWS